MKKSLIISSHSDDGIFSLGSAIPDLGEVIIVSPFDGVPEDLKGNNKHTILNREHREACEVYPNVKIISGDFFDDVYHDTRDLGGLRFWLENILEKHKDYSTYVPLGIHHPDHVLVRDMFVRYFTIDYFYSELPYYVRYPYLYQNLQMILLANRELINITHNPIKELAAKKYQSQTDEGVLQDIFVEERIWK